MSEREEVVVQLEVSALSAEAVVGFVVWLLANVWYLDMKRSGRGGFRRIWAFWLGTPTTWLTLLFVDEGSAVAVEPPPDDEDALLAEIRRDRRLRSGDGSGEPGLHPDSLEPEEP